MAIHQTEKEISDAEAGVVIARAGKSSVLGASNGEAWRPGNAVVKANESSYNNAPGILLDGGNSLEPGWGDCRNYACWCGQQTHNMRGAQEEVNLYVIQEHTG